MWHCALITYSAQNVRKYPSIRATPNKLGTEVQRVYLQSTAPVRETEHIFANMGPRGLKRCIPRLD